MNNELFNIFDSIFVINMPEHTERLRQAETELKSIGINDFIIFNGIKVNNGETIQDREAGCKLSHISIIELCLKQSLNNVLIFEDDVIFSDDFIQGLNNVSDFIKKGEYDLFYFGGNSNGRVNERINHSIIKVNTLYATHSYCISKKAFQDIINLRDQKKPYDMILSRIQGRGNSYCIYPRRTFQREGFSYIQDKHRNYDVVLKENKI